MAFFAVMAPRLRQSLWRGRRRPERPGRSPGSEDMKMGKDGRVAFIGTLTLGVGGVDATNNVGI